MTHVWGRDGNCSHAAKDDGLKGAPEFRKGTKAWSMSLWRRAGKSITASQEAEIYIMCLRIVQTAARSSEDIFLKLWVLSWDLYLLHPNFVESSPGFHRGNDNQLPRFPCFSLKKELLLAVRSHTNVKSQLLMPSDFEELSSYSLKLWSSLS